jgi:predicted nuclease of predicted toxin-antitoxin system
VKFLVDNQLPAALARFIESRGCQAQHVLDIGLAEASDTQIFRQAESEG